MQKTKHEIIKFNRGFPFKIFTFHGKKSDKQVPLHWHEQIELLFCINGLLNVNIANQQFLMSQDDIIYIRSNELHATYSPIVNHVLCIQIPMKWLLQNLGDNFGSKWDIAINTVNNSHIHDIQLNKHLLTISTLLEARNNDLATNLRIKGEIFLVLDSLIKYSTQLNKPNYTTEDEKLKVELLNFVKNNFQTTISLESISKQFGYSSEYCSRIFKRLIGINFKELLTSYRLSNAYDKILNSNENFETIALESGFINYRTMYNAFLKSYDMTPSQLKNLYKSHPTIKQN